MIEIEMITSALDGLHIIESSQLPELESTLPDSISMFSPLDELVSTPLTMAEITAKEHILETMKNTIERMNKIQHIEVLKIFKKFPQIKLNENRNGVYINLSYLPNNSIYELTRYIDYVEAQETNLETMEARKEEYKSFFSNT